MVALVTHLGAVLGLALGLGAAVVWFTGGAEPPSRAGRAAAIATALIYATGLAAAAAHAIPGRGGLWLDMALLLGAAYGAGCALACGLGRVSARRVSSPA
jgi:hypothetical protein